jgi:tetratricopeptide (TPR) repeat protein
MQLRPWGLWSHDGVAAPETPAIRAVLEPALDRWPEHPALCHFYIHTMEAGPEVAKALPAARRLEDLTPGLGHLVHMPSHIYVWTGHYDDVVRVNLEAVDIDDEFVEHAGRDNLYTAYRIHNYHFVTYGAMWEGRRALALEYARRLCDEIPEGLLTAMPDLFEVFTATPYHAMVRFGMWDELLEEPEPLGERQAARAVWRYARGGALASLGRVDEARAEQRAFRAARDLVPETRFLFQNPVSSVLAVADEVLAGEIAYRAGEHERALGHRRQAVELDDAMNHHEPWGWMEPARHALGALLTEQGRYEEALAVYEADLERYPENGWALYGMAECLRGLGRDDEAARVDKRFDKAFARADVKIPGSCYCKGAGAAPRAQASEAAAEPVAAR